MIDKLTTYPEIQAERAETLPAFSGIKLLHVKRKLAELLNLIGRGGIFDEYTRHDISHIDEMLKILDWLIPDSTKSIMSPADWLIVVLGIYFHDLGMLVTKEEFKSRYSSGFSEYRDTKLFAGKEGEDYQAKVMQLPPDDAERFLYQEFIRQKHAERIRAWIAGKASESLGVAHNIIDEVDALLKPLDVQFRNDLGLICESHHLDDLYDLKKYKVSQPYGNSDEETANLQYAAVLLRSADLLHVTNDRTPTTTFRVVNPSDPISQDEWAKQMAVKRVRSQLGQDREGNLDEKAPRDTIEVHAYFTNVNGFFGLTSYLVYAQTQLAKCNEWIDSTRRRQMARHDFPWKYIDQTNIETEGFLKNTFEFTIDQAKVLDLLTGHTLYNDTKVVLRELVQNSLDATRLQKLIDSQSEVDFKPRISLHWDTKERVLSVTDNGTGMSQDVIEKHLLKVGASRYQDAQFKKQYPEFSSISRFGIGVLSTFMVADAVEITTCAQDDDEARQLSLRSVHGKYLIRLLDKRTQLETMDIFPHGTVVKLTVRPSADMGDVLEIARRWIVVPDCDVIVSVDDNLPQQIGFQSPVDALTEVLQKFGIPLDRDVKVMQQDVDGVSMAYAVKWSEFLREWSFLEVSQMEFLGESIYPITERRVDPETVLIGTCIEGVRVDFNTPGFDGRGILAIANVKGPSAPKTNVARSGLETTPELDVTLSTFYQIYLNHIMREMQDMYEQRFFSQTWASYEAGYLLRPLLGETYRRKAQPLNSNILFKHVHMLPLLLVEKSNERVSISFEELMQEASYWTIDGPFFTSAENFLRELPRSLSLSKMLRAFETSNIPLPEGIILCDFASTSLLGEAISETREVDAISISREQRRCDFRWVEKSNPPHWYTPFWHKEEQFLQRSLYELEPFLNGAPGLRRRSASLAVSRLFASRRNALPNLYVGRPGIQVDGLLTEIAIKAYETTFLLPDCEIAKYLVSLYESLKNTKKEDDYLVMSAVLVLVEGLLDTDSAAERQHYIEECKNTRIYKLFPKPSELEKIIQTTNWILYEPSAWVRHEEE